jgi:hypothetical protein
MKLRHGTAPIDDGAEEELTHEVRRAAANLRGGEPEAPPGPYWPNLLVRTNDRLDRATSGKALTISWAARVAIPGVVAILSFLVGLRYFAPQHESHAPTLANVVLSMPQPSIDTLLTGLSEISPAVSVADLGLDPLNPEKEEIASYLINSGSVTTLEESMSDQQVTAVLAALGSYRDQSTRGVQQQ